MPILFKTKPEESYIQTDRPIGRQAGRQADRQTDKQAGRQTDRQAGRQKKGKTDARVERHRRERCGCENVQPHRRRQVV